MSTAPAGPGPEPAGVPLLRNGAFLRFWAAQSSSQLGDEVYVVALPLVVYAATGSSAAMSLIFGLSMAPHVLAGMVGGAVSDRQGPYRLLPAMSAASGTLMAVLAVLVGAGVLDLPLLSVITLAAATSASVLMSSYEAAVPSLVPQELLLEANSRLETTRTLAAVLGPALAGVLVGIGEGAPAIALNAASFLCAAVLLRPLRKRRPASAASAIRWPAVLADVRTGLRSATALLPIRLGIILSTGCNLCTGSIEIYAVFVLRHRLDVSSQTVGLVFTGSSVFSILATTQLPRLKGRLGYAAGMGAGLLGLAMACVLMAFPSHVAVITGALMSATCGSVIFNIQWRSMRQHICGPALTGRISGICRGIAYGGVAVGAWIGGLLTAVSTVGYQIYMLTGAAVLASLAAVALTLLHRTIVAATATPAAAAPGTAVPAVPEVASEQ